LFLFKTFKVLNGLLCADVPLRNYSLTHSRKLSELLFYTHMRRNKSYMKAEMDRQTDSGQTATVRVAAYNTAPNKRERC